MEPIWKVINHTTWRARFDDLIRRDDNRLSPSLVRQVAMASEWSGADYQRAMFQRTDLFRRVQGWFETADYLVTPTLSRTALPIDQDLFEPIRIDGIEVGELRRNWFPYTMPFNITGHPALTLCCGYDFERAADRPAGRRPLPRRGLGAARGRALRGERGLAVAMARPLRPAAASVRRGDPGAGSLSRRADPGDRQAGRPRRPCRPQQGAQPRGMLRRPALRPAASAGAGAPARCRHVGRAGAGPPSQGPEQARPPVPGARHREDLLGGRAGRAACRAKACSTRSS